MKRMNRLISLILAAVLCLSCVACAGQSLEILSEGGSVEQMTLYEGQKLQLAPSIEGKNFVWSVDEPDVATVEADGTLTARRQGTAVVTLTSGKRTAQLRLQVLSGRTAWVIGDSIFDYRDNSETDMVQTIFNTAGYGALRMDNLAGSTIRAARNMGIVDHIESKLYESWETPELIVIFRGTNDAYFDRAEPGIYTKEQTLSEAVEQVCSYFRTLQPQAKIVWLTPLWRADVPASELDVVRETLHSICPKYDVTVFDLHEQGTFGKLNYDNHFLLLYDGIHLHDIGAADMTDILSEYLKGLDS